MIIVFDNSLGGALSPISQIFVKNSTTLLKGTILLKKSLGILQIMLY